MKKLKILAVLAGVLFGFQAADLSAVVIKRRPHRRTVVVVHKGFPIVRPARHVVIHPVVRPVRVVPRVFLPLAFWTGAAVVAASIPGPQLIVWEDGEELDAQEDWAEFTLNCQNTGAKLWLEIARGRVRFDWAEVVFGNGEAQVLDMKEFVREPGFYLLLDFANGREIDHVRMVAKSETPQARVVLKIQK